MCGPVCLVGLNVKLAKNAHVQLKDIRLPTNLKLILLTGTRSSIGQTFVNVNTQYWLPEISKGQQKTLDPKQWFTLGKDIKCGTGTLAIEGAVSPDLKRDIHTGRIESVVRWHRGCQDIGPDVQVGLPKGCSVKQKRTESSEGLTRQQLIDVLGCPSGTFVGGICVAAPPRTVKRSLDLADLTKDQLIEYLTCSDGQQKGTTCSPGPLKQKNKKRQVYDVNEEHWEAFINLLREHYFAGTFVDGVCVAPPPKVRRTLYDTGKLEDLLDSLVGQACGSENTDGTYIPKTAEPKFRIRALPTFEEQFYYPRHSSTNLCVPTNLETRMVNWHLSMIRFVAV
ncbi:MAG: hypothetical protein M1814_004288 [Vezdaea aestivalis]|nr:MAG: hypothetical protein M1814_004288 [Vezdaea aestivalis]